MACSAARVLANNLARHGVAWDAEAEEFVYRGRPLSIEHAIARGLLCHPHIDSPETIVATVKAKLMAAAA